MSPGARLALVDPAEPALSIVAQCRLLKVARSSLYYRRVPVSADDLTLMRRMDELHLAYPFYGSRRLAAALRRDGWSANRKRIKRLMQVMGRGWPKVPAAKPLERPDEGGDDLSEAKHQPGPP